MGTFDAPAVVLTPLKQADRQEFRRRLQAAFTVAVLEKFDPWDGGPIPADEDIEGNLDLPDAAAYQIVLDGQRVGGVVVSIHEETRRGSLDFFFIDVGQHSRGLGLAAWQAVEALYPNTEVWETVTPCFEERNIHFYVNKCGFHIVEFYNTHHPDPHMPHRDESGDEDLPGGETMFRFEKVIRR